jgi:hypothetical protein
VQNFGLCQLKFRQSSVLEIMSGNVGGGGSAFGGAHYATCLSLFFSVVFIIILLVWFNYIWQYLFSKAFLDKKEILTIYIA